MMANEKKFTDQKPRIATESDLKASWSGGKNGKYFRCYLCGHTFILGDYWRWVYANGKDMPGINFIVCKECDGPDVLERWADHKKHIEQVGWWFLRGNGE